MKKRTMVLDAELYSQEAVKLAAFVFSDLGGISVRFMRGKSMVSVSGESADRNMGEFMNEALNQQCRIDLAAKNSKIANIIVTKALLSAAGQNKKRGAK